MSCSRLGNYDNCCVASFLRINNCQEGIMNVSIMKLVLTEFLLGFSFRILFLDLGNYLLSLDFNEQYLYIL